MNIYFVSKKNLPNNISFHRENSDVLNWVENVFKNRMTFLNFILLKSSWIGGFILYISTYKQLVQSVEYTYQKADKYT